MSETIQKYISEVEAAITANDGRILENNSQSHAAVLVRKMFQTADTEVCALAHECADGSYGLNTTISAAREFLSKPNSTLKILVEDDRVVDRIQNGIHKFLCAVLWKDGRKSFDNRRPNVSVRMVRPNVMETYDCNFIMSDGRNIRLEPDRQYHAAVATFGNPDVVERYKRTFEYLNSNESSFEIDLEKQLVS